MQQEVFDGEKLSRIIEKLPKGKPRIEMCIRDRILTLITGG